MMLITVITDPVDGSEVTRYPTPRGEDPRGIDYLRRGFTVTVERIEPKGETK